MHLTKNKTVFTRAAAMICAAFMMTLIFAFNFASVKASAADTAAVTEIGETVYPENLSLNTVSLATRD